MYICDLHDPPLPARWESGDCPSNCSASPQGMGDLMRENEDGVSVMQWLRSAYDQDWKNLLERLKPKMGGLDPRCARRAC